MICDFLLMTGDRKRKQRTNNLRNEGGGGKTEGEGHIRGKYRRNKSTFLSALLSPPFRHSLNKSCGFSWNGYNLGGFRIKYGMTPHQITV